MEASATTNAGTVKAKDLFTDDQKELIKLSIENAELDTSGEIRVHIESNCAGDVLDRATYIFDKLGMQKTALRNGVLIYLAVKTRKFAIIGDAGINKVVPSGFWNDVKNIMFDHFRDGKFTEGLSEAITKTGEQLKKYFPYQVDDINELPDDISFGDN